MTKNVITINDATIDSKVFDSYSKKIHEELKAEYDAKEQAKGHATDFKESIESLELTTKLPKKELTSFFRARFEDSLPKEDEKKVVGTKVIIDRGQLYEVLNSALDN